MSQCESQENTKAVATHQRYGKVKNVITTKKNVDSVASMMYQMLRTRQAISGKLHPKQIREPPPRNTSLIKPAKLSSCLDHFLSESAQLSKFHQSRYVYGLDPTICVDGLVLV